MMDMLELTTHLAIDVTRSDSLSSQIIEHYFDLVDYILRIMQPSISRYAHLDGIAAKINVNEKAPRRSGRLTC